MKTNNIHYFAGCNSPLGFFSYFGELYSADGKWKAYIIKGGAGTGKSTLMKKTAAFIEKEGYDVEYIHCSSDSDSIDAIVVPELNAAVIDGTLPHSIEPKYPGAVENIVDLGRYWNETGLARRSPDIIALTDLCSACHKKSVHYLSAAGYMKQEIKALAKEAVSHKKIQAYCKRFAKRNFPICPGKTGSEKNLFLSAFTPKGNIIYPATVHRYAQTVIGIDDKYGFCSNLIMDNLKNYVHENGYSTISGYCPLEPGKNPEQLIIPELSLAFVRLHSNWKNINTTRNIHCERFSSVEKLKEVKNRFSFFEKIQKELISQATAQLIQAKEVHDKLEKIYASQMNFDNHDNLAFILAEKILN